VSRCRKGIGRRTCHQEVAVSIRVRAQCVTTLGKLFTPTGLDADSRRSHTGSLNRVPLPSLFHDLLYAAISSTVSGTAGLVSCNHTEMDMGWVHPWVGLG